MKKLQKLLGKFFKWGTLLSTLGFVGCTIIQIYARFFMEKAPSWTEEAARLFFVFAIGFASGLALKSNYYVHFDFLFEKMKSSWKKRLIVCIDTFTFILFLVFTYYSLQFVAAGLVEKSPSLKFPMAVAFFGVTLIGFAITFYSFTRLIHHFKTKIK